MTENVPQDQNFGTAPESTDARVPQGGIAPRTAATIMAVVPILALVLFILVGTLADGWRWSWVFFLAVPVTGYLLYGPNAFDKEAKR